MQTIKIKEIQKINFSKNEFKVKTIDFDSEEILFDDGKFLNFNILLNNYNQYESINGISVNQIEMIKA